MIIVHLRFLAFFVAWSTVTAGVAHAGSLPVVQVRTISPLPPSAASYVPASVAAVERAALSTRIAATVEAVHVQEGQHVSRGEVVISLADLDLRGALNAAESSLAAARAHEQRISALVRQRAATPAEMELATAQRAQAEAAVAAARANLGYSKLRAPFSGVVRSRRVEPGDMVGPGQPLVDLEGEALELQASLSETEARGLNIGSVISFVVDDIRGTAKVTALTPGGDPITHRRTVRARISSAIGAVKTGAFARLELAGVGTNHRPAWVPRSALVERGDLIGVFVAFQGRAELRWIAPGEPMGEGMVVRAGLREDERIINYPGALRDGQSVEVLP